MGLLKKFFGNTRKPQGFLGKLMVGGMNTGSHAALAEWALDDFSIDGDAKALDVGCGGGANVARLLERCRLVCGVDYSEVSVEKSVKVNRKAIEENRCEILEGNVAALPFKDGRFDVVTAFETIYFWPDIVKSFRQVLRVLKEGGRFLIANEADGTDTSYVKWEKVVEGMHTYTTKEIEEALAMAGFCNIQTTRNRKGHIRVTAAKPAL